MRYRICESAGSDGESVNLHPVTRLASDLGRTCQKYPRTVQKYVCTVQYLDGLRHNPVRSLYNIPVCLSANIPKQKIFPTELSSSSTMTFGPCLIVPTLIEGSDTSSTLLLLLMGAACTFGSCCSDGGACGCRCVVLWIPWWGRFMWPFAVAGLGLRYRVTPLSVRLGHPLRKP